MDNLFFLIIGRDFQIGTRSDFH